MNLTEGVIEKLEKELKGQYHFKTIDTSLDSYFEHYSDDCNIDDYSYSQYSEIVTAMREKMSTISTNENVISLCAILAIQNKPTLEALSKNESNVDLPDFIYNM